MYGLLCWEESYVLVDGFFSVAQGYMWGAIFVYLLTCFYTFAFSSSDVIFFTSKFHTFHMGWILLHSSLHINPLLSSSRSTFLLVTTCELFIAVEFPVPGLCPIFYFLMPVLLSASSRFSTSQASPAVSGLYFSICLLSINILFYMD